MHDKTRSYKFILFNEQELKATRKYLNLYLNEKDVTMKPTQQPLAHTGTSQVDNYFISDYSPQQQLSQRIRSVSLPQLLHYQKRIQLRSSNNNKDTENFIQKFKTWSFHWIPYDNFQNIKYIADGGHGSVYSGELENGIKVDQKIDILFSIASGLGILHLDLCKLENNLILNANDKYNKIYGSIPYISPVPILRGNEFTEEGDIYSFGGIMYEIVTAQRPFADQIQDTYLMIDICYGVRLILC
ncbi:hypothetical protein Glove_84g85 [Diversispora epigaea]|uniref:Protein kinase domain-containing protein n=1 Tax=Diversispora epigaea TaxID=1348612 RepID=A0A397J9S9_9GLOM|nr:hypothetical protein Glove_84g85 [Diversispora epigaea]